MGVNPHIRNARTALAVSEPTHTTGLSTTLGWSCYLGSSWTWVIGMVWPVIIVRDYGVWGWAAFAVPNVLGVTATWYLPGGSPSRS